MTFPKPNHGSNMLRGESFMVSFFSYISPHTLYRCTGDMVHFRVFNQSIIVVNSKKIADDLFEKRGQVYSDRPYIAMIGFSIATFGKLHVDKLYGRHDGMGF
jgi:hypothetical protein